MEVIRHGAARNARMESSRHSSLENAVSRTTFEAARAFSQANRGPTCPDELCVGLPENAASYHPRWATSNRWPVEIDPAME
jgi:hypothetical protein